VSTGAERSLTIPSSDGISLHVRLASPQRPRGAMLLCHGLTTDRDEHGQFSAVRDVALAHGLAVGRFDFRAHGESTGSNEALTLAGLRADADAVADRAQEHWGEALPLIAMGVSFGAGPAVHLAATRAAAGGLALWYPVVDYAWNFGPESPVPLTQQMRAQASADDPAWSAMPLVGTRYYFPHALVDEFARDHTAATLRGLELPVLAYQGSRDKLVDLAPLRRIASEREGIEIRVVPGAGHGFLLWRRWIVRQTVRWAAQRLRR
jgi:hypothetical protein